MDFFPAFLDLRGRPCLVVGAGDIALCKTRLLLSAGAVIKVVAPATNKAFADFAAEHSIDLKRREFCEADVRGNWLVISATGDPAVEQTVFNAATKAGIFCNSVDDKSRCSYITPAVVDRSPIVVAISSGGAAPVLARKLRAKIESVLPQDLGRLASLAGRWRARVSSTIDDLIGRRRFWESVFEGRIAGFALGGYVDRAEQEMARRLVDFDKSPLQRGQAWLVGAGPGDPELLTLRALQIMQAADVILHDRLVSDEILALARRDADRISVGKIPGSSMNAQEKINATLIAHVKAGKRVCRLKGGDPFIFGRGGEELEALRAAGLPCEVVPGITAVAGCAASAGIPLTHRDISQSVVMVSAHGKGSVDRLDWRSLARDRQTLAFYMAVRRFPDLMNKLILGGRAADTPIAIIERGTCNDERVIRGSLGQLALLADARRVKAPAILIVGAVAALAENAVAANVVPLAAGAAQTAVVCAKHST